MLLYQYNIFTLISWQYEKKDIATFIVKSRYLDTCPCVSRHVYAVIDTAVARQCCSLATGTAVISASPDILPLSLTPSVNIDLY